MILKELAVGPYESNCFILGAADGQGMVIDPGDDAGDILNAISELKITVKTIVLTHSHIDHIGALKKVKEATGAEFVLHTDEAKFLRQQGPLQALFGRFSAPPAPDRLLKGGDSLDVSELHFLVLHTPGHTPGGICLYGHGRVFTGDTLFNYGIGRTDFPGGSYSQLLNSIITKLMVLPDPTIVHPGHGPDSTIGDERRGNPFLRGA